MKVGWWDGDYAVVQPWGCTNYTAEPADPSCASGHIHRGIDFAVPLNTIIRAPIDGVRLTAVGNDPYGFGPNYPILRMPDGQQIIIGHTRQVMGSPRVLNKGETFALSGNEGMSTGPHVHFQANASSGDFHNSVNPAPWLDPAGPQEDFDLSDTQYKELKADLEALINGSTDIRDRVDRVEKDSQAIINGSTDLRDRLADLKSEVDAIKTKVGA